jgi:hypothetical protein
MIDILEFIDELKELQSLYHNGELRDFDFATKIQRYDRILEEFERSMGQEAERFFRPEISYNPVHEV